MDKITSKSTIRPELGSIYFTPDKMVATDSYRLIEVKKDIEVAEPCVIKAKGFKGRETVSIDDHDIVNDGGKLIQGARVDAEYPDYEQLFDLGEPKFTMLVNAKYLAELAAEVDAQAHDTMHKMRIDFYGERRPLILSAEGEGGKGSPKVFVRAALSPIQA